jgi:ARG and Rhodanese-Phosphatase-superfamily-associated Protein domain
MLDIRLGPPRRHKTLSIIPLVTSGAAELPYLLLADALVAGTLRITEVGSGMVPRLLADNTGDLDVLVLDGEQLIGAKQNRMTNRTILLPARTRTEIPVSCMEQGRWRFDSEVFASSPQHSPAKVRRKARDLEVAYVAEGMAPADGVLAGAQSAVWSEIDGLSGRARSTSRSVALDGAFDASSTEIAAWAKAFPPMEGQVGLLGLTRLASASTAGPAMGMAPGAAQAHGEEATRPDAFGLTVIGMDVIGSPVLYARLHERLLHGYIMDALDTMRVATDEPPRTREGAGARNASESRGGFVLRCDDQPYQPHAAGDVIAAQRFLEAVQRATRTEAPSVGRGRYEVLSGTVVGGALTDDILDPERVVHNSAFPLEPDRSGDTGDGLSAATRPVAPPSARRRRTR